MSSSTSLRPGVAGRQTVIGAVVLATMASTCIPLDIAAHDESLRMFFNRDERKKERQSGGTQHAPREFFLDSDVKLIYDELPMADYSRGGFYVIGASNASSACSFWELEPRERALIHNYGMLGTSHLMQFQLVRYLVEQKGLLQAGPEKTMILFGVSHHCAIPEGEGNAHFRDSWERYGCYKVPVTGDIEAVPMSDVKRFIRIERMRVAGLIERSLTWAVYTGLGLNRPSREPRTAQDYARRIKGRAGSNWETKVDEQVVEFGRMLDYLQERDVPMAVVFLPLGAIEDELPYEARYNRAVSEVCRERRVPLLDWSRMVSEEDFGVGYHLSVRGMEKVHPEILKIAREHLKSTGALSDGT